MVLDISNSPQPTNLGLFIYRLTGCSSRIARAPVSLAGNRGLETHCRVKPKTYKIDTCRILTWCSAVIGYGKDWLVQYQDNVTEWDIRSWLSHNEYTLSQVSTSPDMTLDVTRTYNKQTVYRLCLVERRTGARDALVT